MEGDRLRIRTPVQVMYFDTDAGGVVHNLAYLRMIETARTLLAIQLGMTFEEIARTGIHPVLVHTSIDYRKPARLGDHLVISGLITEVSRARFWVEFSVHPDPDGPAHVSCRQELAFVRMPEGKPVRLSEGSETLARLLAEENPG